MGIRMSNKLENLGDAVPDVSLRQLGDHNHSQWGWITRQSRNIASEISRLTP